MHPRDSKIRLGKWHKYSIDWLGTGSSWSDAGITSVSELVKTYFHTFQEDLIIHRIVNSKTPNPKYENKTKAEIKQEWKETRETACRLGTEMHQHIENFYSSNIVAVEYSDTPEWKQFQNFHHEMVVEQKLVPFRAEWRIYTDQTQSIAGTVDMLYAMPD